jgi:hypothetical protein
MPYATGIETQAAVKKASTWGTPVACAAADGVLVLPPTLKRERPLNMDDSLGSYFSKEADPGGVKVEGDLPAYLRYDGLDLLLALTLGASAGAPVQQGTSGAYAQSFSLSANMEGLFATLALNNNVNIDEYASAKITGLKLKGRVGEPLQISFKVLAADRVTDSSTNTLGTFSSVTLPQSPDRVLMSQGLFKMNDSDGAALDLEDEISPSAFELNFDRPMAGAYVAGAAGDLINEPISEGQPEVTLKLEFPRYSSSVHFEDWASGIRKKLEIAFTGSLIGETYYRSFKLSFPNLAYKEVDLPIERGPLKHPLEFVSLATSLAPAGMSGVLTPFQVDVVNSQSADVLG